MPEDKNPRIKTEEMWRVQCHKCCVAPRGSHALQPKASDISTARLVSLPQPRARATSLSSTLQLSSLCYLETDSQLVVMAKTRSKRTTKKQAAAAAAAPAPEPEPPVAEPAAQEETPIVVDEPAAASVEVPAAEVVKEVPATEKPVESEEQEMVVDSQAQEEAVAKEAEKEEESQGPKLTLEERKAKIQQLRAKMVRLLCHSISTTTLILTRVFRRPFCHTLQRSSTIANRADVIEESEKAKMSVRDAARLEKQRKLAEVLRSKADAEERGEDVERLKNWEWTIEENDEWEKKLARKQRRADFEFHGASLCLPLRELGSRY